MKHKPLLEHNFENKTNEELKNNYDNLITQNLC